MSWSWGSSSSSTQLSSSKTKQKLNPIIENILSKNNTSIRARKEIEKSISNGDSEWVQILYNKQTTSKLLNKEKLPNNIKQLPVKKISKNLYSGKKMHDQIMKDNPNEREQYKGGPKPMDREKEIEKLTNIFAYGKDYKIKKPLNNLIKENELTYKEELITQILREIEERREFLLDIKDKEMCERTRFEISVRLKELEKLGIKFNY